MGGGEQHTLLEWYTIAMQHYQDGHVREARIAAAEVRRLERGGYCDCMLRAMNRFANWRLTEALVCYERAIALQDSAPAPLSSDPTPHLCTALTLMSLGRADEALAACERGSAALPAALELYLLRGALQLDLGRLDEALASYEQALLRDPTSTEALTFKGFALYALGRSAESLQVHEQLVALEPERPEAHLFKGRVLEQLGRLAEAAACYEEAIRLDSSQSDAWAYKGGVLWQMRDEGPDRLAEAAACYEEAIRLDPESALAHNGLGNVLMARKRYREALTAYARASALQPDVKAFRYNRQQAARAAEGLDARGVWAATSLAAGSGPLMQEYLGLQGILKLMEGERLEEALAACERAGPMVREPGFAHVLLMMKGTILEAMDRCEEALTTYGELIAASPESADGYYWRARVALKLEEERDVLPDLERATALDPTWHEAWALRGDLLAGARRFKEALAAYDRALALHGSEALLHNKRGQVLAQLGRHEQALAAYHRATEIEPDHPYHWMNSALALAELGRHMEALQAYETAIQLEPHSPLASFLLFNKGNLLIHVGRHAEALACFEHAIDYEQSEETRLLMGGTDSVTLALVHYGKGRSLTALHRYAEALASFEAARALWPDLPDLSHALAYAQQELRRQRVPAAAAEQGEKGRGSSAGGERGDATRRARSGRASEPGRRKTSHFVDLLIWSVVVAGGVLWLLSSVIEAFGPRLNALIPPFGILSLALYPLSCWLGFTWRVESSTGATPSPLLWADTTRATGAGEATTRPGQQIGLFVSSTRPTAEIWRVRLRRLSHASLFGALYLLVATVAAAELVRIDSPALPFTSLVQLVLLGTLLLLMHVAVMLAALLALRVLRRHSAARQQAGGSEAPGA